MQPTDTSAHDGKTRVLMQWTEMKERNGLSDVESREGVQVVTDDCLPRSEPTSGYCQIGQPARDREKWHEWVKDHVVSDSVGFKQEIKINCWLQVLTILGDRCLLFQTSYNELHVASVQRTLPICIHYRSYLQCTRCGTLWRLFLIYGSARLGGQ